MRIRLLTLLLPLLAPNGPLMAQADLPVAPNHKFHTEIIKGSQASFTVEVGGQTPTVNRSIEITGPAENVRLKVEGGLDFSSIEALAASLTRPSMTDEEKVKACFYFAVNNFYDRVGSGCDDPLEYVNLWDFSYCGEFGLTLNALWKAAGFNAVFLNPVTLGLPSGHTLAAVYYDNQWHLYDSRLRGYFLNWDNKTVASLIELDKDDNLIRRAVDFSGGMNHKHWSYATAFLQFFNAQSDWLDGFNAHFNNLTLFNGNCPHWDGRVNLRANEKLTLSWTNRGKWWSRKDLSPRWKELHPGESIWETVPPIIYGNGTLEFRPDPRRYRQEARDFADIRVVEVKDGFQQFQPSGAGKRAYVVYRVRAPYFIPSLSVQAKGFRKGEADQLSVELSTDEGASWMPLWEAQGSGEQEIGLTTDETQRVSMYSANKYSYLLRFGLEASRSPSDVRLGDIRVETDLFYRQLSLPELKAGTNRVIYSDSTSGRHSRQVTFNWLEDSNIRLSEDRPCAGDELTLTGVVKNAGNAPARDVVVRFYDGDPAQGGEKIGEDQVIASIEPGGTAEAKVSWRAVQRQIVPGLGTLSPEQEIRGYGYTHNTLYLQADTDNGISESDESNNLTSRELVVYNMANLILYDPSFVTFDRQGEKVRISAMVRNQNLYGLLPHAREARDVTVRFYDGQPVQPRRARTYNTDNLIGESVIPSIDPGEFGTARVEWDVKGLSGRHLVYVVVDLDDKIPEVWQGGRRSWMPVKKEIIF